MDLIRTITLISIPLFLAACSNIKNLSTVSSSLPDFASSIAAGTLPTGSTTTTSNDPVLAEPPPITLGSYPWIVITKAIKSADGKTVTYQGLVLDEDDPPGIYTRSGYLRVGPRSNTVIYPIVVLNNAKGLISFQIPVGLFNNVEMTAVMTGPGYTDVDFPVCD